MHKGGRRSRRHVQSVKGTGETIETGGKREHGRGQGRADQVSGVGRDIATLVVRVDGQVETHQLNEVGVLSEAQHVGQVVAIVLVLLDLGNLTVLEDVAVDTGSNAGQLSDQVHAVLEGVLPVVLLVDTTVVGLGKLRLALEGGNSHGELGHGVQVLGASVDQLLNVLGERGAGSPVGRQGTDLSLRGDLTSEEEPEKTLGEGFLTTGGLGEELLAFWDLRTRKKKEKEKAIVRVLKSH